MAITKKTDSSGLNHWKLCKKCNGIIHTKTTSELSDIARENLSKNKIDDSQLSSRSSQQNLQIRRINPAIYVKSSNASKSKIHKDTFSTRKSDGVDLNIKISNIRIHSNSCPSFKTYRCRSLILQQPAEVSPLRKSESLHTVERRCRIDDQSDDSIDYVEPEVQRYFVNGNQIVQISTSLSNFTLSQRSSGISLAKKQAYDRWMKKKRLEILQRKKEAEKLELQKKNEEERLKQKKEEKRKLSDYNFLVWFERKRKENMYKRTLAKKKFELKRHINELEANTVLMEKIFVEQWYQKKEIERKALKRNEELRIQKFEKERQQKLQENSKAFKSWQKQTKNRSRPASQGLLPHQQAQPRYINPIAWVVDQISLEISENQIGNNETTSNTVKSN